MNPADTWTRWHNFAELALAAGLIPDLSKATCRKLADALQKAIDEGKVERYKVGNAHSHAAYYRPIKEQGK